MNGSVTSGTFILDGVPELFNGERHKRMLALRQTFLKGTIHTIVNLAATR